MAFFKVALITGSTRGIGFAMAYKLAKEKKRIILNYLSNEREAKNALEKIKKVSPYSIVLRADVSNPKEAEDLINKTFRHFKRIDILINNVGPFIFKDIFETELNEWHYMVNTNLSSAFYCTKFVLPMMRKQGSGCIINIGLSNTETAKGFLKCGVYAACKTALMSLTKSLALSEARYGIRVNAVNPGFITYPQIQIEDLKNKIPLKKLGSSEDIANLVSFLVSDKASYINGAIINVHGGMGI
jgi:3-oxoacyl-[acyl-carrier protein] reductase